MKLPKIPFATFLLGPTVCEYVGAALNQIVMGVNGAMMPVLFPDGWNYSVDGRHTPMTAATHLKFLGDWLNLQSAILSPGDLLIMLGDTMILPGLLVWATLMIAKHNFERSR
jgi:hypothetical protein